MALDAKEIPGVLRGLKWEPRAIDDRTWRATLQTSVGVVRVVVRHAGAWLYLSIIPFFEPGTIDRWGAGTYPIGFLGRLLAVNRNLNMVKFALDDDGDVVLKSELPTENLQASEVAEAVSQLLKTAEQYRQPVRDALLEAGRAAPPS
ncbi:MAG: YbjN domain-containing protein [Polyangiales bacterium]